MNLEAAMQIGRERAVSIAPGVIAATVALGPTPPPDQESALWAMAAALAVIQDRAVADIAAVEPLLRTAGAGDQEIDAYRKAAVAELMDQIRPAAALSDATAASETRN